MLINAIPSRPSSASSSVIFVHFDPDQQQQLDPQQPPSHVRRTLWSSDRCTVFGIDIFAFLLLDAFGKDRADQIAHFVSQNLIKTLFDAPKLGGIVEEINAEEQSGRRTNTQRSSLDNQIEALLKEIFARVDNCAYEAMLERLLLPHPDELGKEQQHGEEMVMNSGCSALLALIIGRRLIVANCGGSTLAIFCKDSNGSGDALSTIRMAAEIDDESAEEEEERQEVHPPLRCFFGGFGHKARTAAATVKTDDNESGQKHRCSSSSPTVHPQIELDYSSRFLLLLPRHLWQLVQQKMCTKNQSPDSAIANVVFRAAYEEEEGRKRAENVRKALADLLLQSSRCAADDHHQWPNNKVGLSSLALIDLQSAQFAKMMHFGDEKMGETLTPNPKSVRSEVDWSEFHTHHLKEEVLAKIASLNQLYGQQQQKGPKLEKINENC